MKKCFFKNDFMIDFTASLYLGMQHSSAELEGWSQLTTGKPSALFEPPQSKKLASKIANLQGLEAGYIAPSTLHLYYDLHSFLSQQKVMVFIDEKVYPVSKYGIEKLYLNNIAVHPFRHQDAAHLVQLVNTKIKKRYQPVVITDGWCPQCGRPAPLDLYAEILKPYGGFIIVDDTQAMGIFGKRNSQQGYGSGGGGILQWLNVSAPNVICISSLAKGFGVPLAAISGSASFIDLFKTKSQVMECSGPPGLVHLAAGLHALQINKYNGDKRRAQLFKNVSMMKMLLNAKGVRLNGGVFPVQSLNFNGVNKADAVYNNLLKDGIETVLTAGHKKAETAVTFIITSKHTRDEIEHAVFCVGKVLVGNVYPGYKLKPFISFNNIG